MEVAPSGDQDLCIAAGRVVRQTKVARLVVSLTPISLTPLSLTPTSLTLMPLTPPARSSLILRAHTQAWHGQPGQRELEWAGDRAAKQRARMHGARAASLSPPAGDEAATRRRKKAATHSLNACELTSVVLSRNCPPPPCISSAELILPGWVRY